MRAGRWVTAVLAGTVALAGCTAQGGATDDAAAAGAAAALEPASLLLWDTVPVGAADTTSDVVAEFEAEHDGIDVEIVSLRSDEVLAEFIEAVTDDAVPVPDVVRLAASTVSGLAAGGALLDLDPTAVGARPEEFNPAAWLSGTLDGALFAVPQAAAAPMVLFDSGNADGVTADRLDSTASLSGSDGPALAAAFSSETLLPFVFGEGGRLVSAPGQEILIAAEPAVAGFSAALDLAQEGPLRVFASSDTPALDARRSFLDGGTAAILAGWSDYRAIASDSLELPEGVRILPPPAGSAGGRGTPYEGFSLVASATTEAPAAAQALIAALAGDAAQLRYAQQRVFPTRSAVYAAEEVSGVREVQEYRAVLDTAVPPPAVGRSLDLYPPVMAEWRNMLAGLTTPRSGAVMVAREWLPLLPDGYRIRTGAMG